LSLFVDTSAFYAAADSRDRHHRRAAELLSDAGGLATTDHVLVESWRLMRDLSGYANAERFWAEVRRGLATVETVLPGDLDTAWRIGEAFPDQDFSIVDRTSFAVMERLGITSAASFDAHFSIYRFGPRRERAFQVRC
jgi:predicted nucleic acid-binding protein